jgi:hypothetical protein
VDIRHLACVRDVHLVPTPFYQFADPPRLRGMAVKYV